MMVVKTGNVHCPLISQGRLSKYQSWDKYYLFYGVSLMADCKTVPSMRGWKSRISSSSGNKSNNTPWTVEIASSHPARSHGSAEATARCSHTDELQPGRINYQNRKCQAWAGDTVMRTLATTAAALHAAPPPGLLFKV